MAAIGRLSVGIAHDFNNLLTAITGYIELMIMEMSQDDPKIQDAYEVRNAAFSAARLTGQLLAFSRPRATQVLVLDVNAIVARTARLLRRTLGDDIDVRLDLAPQMKPIKADPAHLEQIVLNLAVNARDAMPTGGQLTIKTCAHMCNPGTGTQRTGREYVRLTIGDTGCGIAEALQPKVFERFFSTKGKRGTGIGLTTVYELVSRNGGRIDLESTEGIGTTFTIDLPTTSEAADDPESVVLAPHFVNGFATILVVEDDSRVRELAELILRRAGHDIVSAAGPREALRLLAVRPDVELVLTDIVMPDMNGYDLAKEIRRMAPKVHLVFMSGGAPQSRAEADEPFLSKPFTAESLTRVVQDTLAPALC
jgi:CheY-like chemotaxis protein